MKKLYSIGAFILLFAFCAFSSYFTVDQGERGVVLRFGKIKEVANAGLGFKMPFFDDVKYLDAKSQVTRMSLPAYSKDQQPANMVVSVNWHVSDFAKAYSEYGDLKNLSDRVVYTNVPQSVKTVFGQFAAATSIQQRDKLNVEIANEVERTIRGPIVIESIQLDNIDFSSAYEQSVEARMLAEVEVAKLHQNAEREKVQAQITVTRAQAEADAVKASANAEAAAIAMKGNAEASALEAKAKVLRDNPLLIDYTKADHWNGALPSTMMGGAVPMFNVK